ncbi:alpha-amylase family glycosyl hydrolase [Aggregatilinea lenta]|uniref:alpha-amylase family glycosyl hydrolase n=1 Tax=Aggregatilinea lenta TaxID=913108 RepID=UPI000E5B6AAE|nr:alpha-amylase family glycosyl hydrolase [Aggregatilinea lenta]
MTSWPNNPLLYEINAWTWLQTLSEKYDRPVTLADVPDADLDEIAAWPFDAVWLMGVWERSAEGRRIALEHPGLQHEYHQALPDFTPQDVIGSPYSVHRYVVDAHLGGPDALASIRTRLAERGMKLVLDFVPNHTATDHPWLETHPDAYLHGTPQELASREGCYFYGPGASADQIFACGRDPYFPPWTDTAQLNAFDPTLRALAIETLHDIAAQCDGVRCDMGMLMVTRIFTQTWGDRAGHPLAREFWTEVIPAVKAQHADFLFIAEVYWDMEWELQQQGFDYTYDKRLYDRLLTGPAHTIAQHLYADLSYQDRLVRLIENHDEARAQTALGPARHRPAAVLACTLPGATLIHEGQTSGCRIKLPVQLGRRPHEEPDRALEGFYRALLADAALPIYRDGTWCLRNVASAEPGGGSFANLIAYTWQLGDERRVIVINYAPGRSRGRVLLPDFGLEGASWTLREVRDGTTLDAQPGDDLARTGLLVELPGWGAVIWSVE